MSRLTSVKISPLTLKWIRRLKSAWEYTHGKKLTVDETIYLAIINTDHILAYSYGITKKDLNKYADEIENNFGLEIKEERDIISPIIIDSDLGKWKCPECGNWNNIQPAWVDEDNCQNCGYKKR